MWSQVRRAWDVGQVRRGGMWSQVRRAWDVESGEEGWDVESGKEGLGSVSA